MALYGHVPFMLGHSAAHTTGFFWLNAAETWIDVDKSTAGQVSTHWISESGIIDMFLLPGPTPKVKEGEEKDLLSFLFVFFFFFLKRMSCLNMPA